MKRNPIRLSPRQWRTLVNAQRGEGFWGSLGKLSLKVGRKMAPKLQKVVQVGAKVTRQATPTLKKGVKLSKRVAKKARKRGLKLTKRTVRKVKKKGLKATKRTVKRRVKRAAKKAVTAGVAGTITALGALAIKKATDAKIPPQVQRIPQVESRKQGSQAPR